MVLSRGPQHKQVRAPFDVEFKAATWVADSSSKLLENVQEEKLWLWLNVSKRWAPAPQWPAVPLSSWICCDCSPRGTHVSVHIPLGFFFSWRVLRYTPHRGAVCLSVVYYASFVFLPVGLKTVWDFLKVKCVVFTNTEFPNWSLSFPTFRCSLLLCRSPSSTRKAEVCLYS